MKAHDDASAEPSTHVAAAIQQAAERAILAPSIFNTQPWQFVISDHALDIYADFERHLQVLDPQARQMHISCGCAVLNARIALESMGYTATREWLPDPQRSAHVARIRIRSEPPAESALAGLTELIPVGTSDPQGLLDAAVSGCIIGELAAAAEAEHAVLVPLATPELRLAAAAICEQADQLQNRDPACRAETRYWTTTELHRRDGIEAARSLRSFGAGDRTHGYLSHRHAQSVPVAQPTAPQCLLVLGTVADEPLCWLRAGEALERILLIARGHQIAAEIHSTVIEIPHTRMLLRTALELNILPQVVLRVGPAKSSSPSRRRHPSQMIRHR